MQGRFGDGVVDCPGRTPDSVGTGGVRTHFPSHNGGSELIAGRLLRESADQCAERAGRDGRNSGIVGRRCRLRVVGRSWRCRDHAPDVRVHGRRVDMLSCDPATIRKTCVSPGDDLSCLPNPIVFAGPERDRGRGRIERPGGAEWLQR